MIAFFLILLGFLYLLAHLVPSPILLVLKVTHFRCHCIRSSLLVYKTEKVSLSYIFAHPLSLEISFIRTADKPLLTSNISIAKICRFLWCIDAELSFSNNLMNDDCLSLYIIRKHLSWSRFIFLLFVRL